MVATIASDLKRWGRRLPIPKGGDVVQRWGRRFSFQKVGTSRLTVATSPPFSISHDVPTLWRRPHLLGVPNDVPTFWDLRTTSPPFSTCPPFEIGRIGCDHSFTTSDMALGPFPSLPSLIQAGIIENAVLGQHSTQVPFPNHPPAARKSFSRN